MKNEAQLSPNNRSNGALPECSGNSEASAIVSKRRILNSAKHKCGDFRPSARTEGGRMRIIGCDLHARQQTLAMLNTTTGEVVSIALLHEENHVREFYSTLPRPGARGG